MDKVIEDREQKTISKIFEDSGEEYFREVESNVLEELSDIKIDYIKIDKDLTQNIHNDLVKKHRIKNIIVFAEVNDVKVMVENVESDKDYAFLSKLDLYAVNR